MAGRGRAVGQEDMSDTLLPLPDVADRLWDSLLRREPRQDAVYAVATQGVWCRFGCPSRLPLRRNTRFFADGAEAEAAGFRPCRRCDPRGERAVSMPRRCAPPAR